VKCFIAAVAAAFVRCRLLSWGTSAHFLLQPNINIHHSEVNMRGIKSLLGDSGERFMLNEIITLPP
jgi:hypothetical protein